MLTMNQVGTLINTVQLVIIFGFVFCMIQMIMNHILRMKSLCANDAESEHYHVLKRQLTTGLMFLFFCLLGALILMGFLQGWSSSSFEIPIDSHPQWRRQVTNEVINVIRVFVISCFVGGGTKVVLRYREQVAKLKDSNRNQVMNRDELDRRN